MLKFPSIQNVEYALRAQKETMRNAQPDDPNFAQCGLDVQLHIRPEGTWSVTTGPISPDRDRSGYWGSCVLGVKANCRKLAKTLIEECRVDEATTPATDSGSDHQTPAPAMERSAEVTTTPQGWDHI